MTDGLPFYGEWLIIMCLEFAILEVFDQESRLTLISTLMFPQGDEWTEFSETRPQIDRKNN